MVFPCLNQLTEPPHCSLIVARFSYTYSPRDAPFCPIEGRCSLLDQLSEIGNHAGRIAVEGFDQRTWNRKYVANMHHFSLSFENVLTGVKQSTQWILGDIQETPSLVHECCASIHLSKRRRHLTEFFRIVADISLRSISLSDRAKCSRIAEGDSFPSALLFSPKVKRNFVTLANVMFLYFAEFTQQATY